LKSARRMANYLKILVSIHYWLSNILHVGTCWWLVILICRQHVTLNNYIKTADNEIIQMCYYINIYVYYFTYRSYSHIKRFLLNLDILTN